MWTIDPIDRASADELIVAAAARRRAEIALCLRNGRELLASRYDEYDAAQAALRELPTASTHDTALNDALSYLYTQMRDEVRAKILLQHRDRTYRVSNCALCGIDTAGTLDHYLPQAASCYPEFACYARNLIPCCATCNGLRGHRKWRETLNPYFDDIPANELGIEARIEWLCSPPSVHITGAATPFGRRMGVHLRALNLVSRIGEVAAILLARWRSELRGLRELGEVKVIFLERKKETAIEMYGVHHWEAALADAAKRDLAEFSAFVDGP